ncbi:MAG: pilus assembly protein PilM, partial [bacterium]
MNIFNLLTKKKRIVGVEISDNAIRVSYFRPKKGLQRANTKNELILAESNLEINIVSGGVVLNKELLAKTLKDIWNKEKLNSCYAIIAIPEDKVYSRIFPFPKTANGSQLVEAINLAIDFELPVKREEVYVGWENAGDSNVINEILISSIPKIVANGYIDALNIAGIKVLALETHLFSIARSAKFTFGQTVLFKKVNPKGFTVFILKDRSLRFSRTIPTTSQNEEFYTSEANRIKTWFEYEKNAQVFALPLSEATIRDEYLKYIDGNKITIDQQSKWLISLGAAIRGEIKEGEDNQISLLPIGTAEAYAYQKITIFIDIMRNITIGISLFFLVAFLAVYLLVLSLSQNNKINTNISVSTSYPDTTQKEEWIKNINDITSTSKDILSSMVNWSVLLDDIKSRTINGITISSFSAKSISEKINIIGIAKDRDTLNQFKKSIQESPYVSNVELPITNLEQKADIPFSLSFDIRDPSMLY